MSISVQIKKRLSPDFTLDVAFQTDGERLGVLGASGSGKSMTLKCLAGIETPDQGRIVVNNRVLFDSEQGINLKPQARRVGYLFQTYALFPKMTVTQNITSGIRLGDRVDVQALLAQFGLQAHAHRYPAELSGGEQQRVALARILANNPDVILLDEPFSALDTHLREHLQLELPSLLAGIPDVILVTHSRDEVYRLCPHLLVLDQGRALAQGATQTIFTHPTTKTVARLIGCKNISRIRKLDAHRVAALDWGIELSTATPVEDTHHHLAIRAHDLRPADTPDTPNTFPVDLLDQTPDVFEHNFRFRPTGTEAIESLWWKVSKTTCSAPPAYLQLPPESLMLLR